MFSRPVYLRTEIFTMVEALSAPSLLTMIEVDWLPPESRDVILGVPLVELLTSALSTSLMMRSSKRNEISGSHEEIWFTCEYNALVLHRDTHGTLDIHKYDNLELLRSLYLDLSLLCYDIKFDPVGRHYAILLSSLFAVAL